MWVLQGSSDVLLLDLLNQKSICLFQIFLIMCWLLSMLVILIAWSTQLIPDWSVISARLPYIFHWQHHIQSFFVCFGISGLKILVSRDLNIAWLWNCHDNCHDNSAKYVFSCWFFISPMMWKCLERQILNRCCVQSAALIERVVKLPWRALAGQTSSDHWQTLPPMDHLPVSQGEKRNKGELDWALLLGQVFPSLWCF